MSDQPDNKVQAVQVATERVKDQLHENINVLIERGEKLDELQAKSETLEKQGAQFEKKGREVKNAMCWQSYRNLLIIIILVAIIALVIGLSVWGATKK